MAEKLYLQQTDPSTFIYLDSVFSKSRNMNFNQGLDIRYNLILLLSRIGGKELNSLSNNFLSDIIENSKFNGVVNKVIGVAEEGNFYRAKTSLPSTLTETEDLIARACILWQASIKKESEEERKNWMGLDQFLIYESNYINFVPF